MSGLQEYLGLSSGQLEECLVSGDFHFRDYQWLRDVGDELLKYRIEVRQAIPTRLKSAFTWNINSWKTPKSSREDPKMRRIKKLLRDGPVLLQETKWHHNQEEILLQHISGLQIISSNAIRTDHAILSGGVAVLLPAGWTIEQKIVLMAGRAIAVLVNDRCAPFYLISIYLHPDFVSRELEQIIHAWRNTEKKSDKIVMGGTSTKQMKNVLSSGRNSFPCFLLWMYTQHWPLFSSPEARLHLIVGWFRRTGLALPSGIPK